MSTWKPGMKAVSIRKGTWSRDPEITAPDPRYGDVYTVLVVEPMRRGTTGLVFEERPHDDVYAAFNFRPLLDDHNEAELSRIEEEGAPVPELIEA